LEKRKSFLVSIDIEEDLPIFGRERSFEGVTQGVPIFLDLMGEFGVPATLFFTGEVAQMFPDLLKQVDSKHEVGCHGLFHESIIGKGASLVENLDECKIIFKKIANREILGFRAFSFILDSSLTKILEQLNFEYDSSVLSSYPIVKPYAGFKGKAPRLPYHPSYNDYRTQGDSRLMEMPVPALPLICFPWSGTWMRVFGNKLYKLSVSLNNDEYILLALHSWDFIKMRKRSIISHNSGEPFTNILRDIFSFFLDHGYEFRILLEEKRLRDQKSE
jgi:hypothetical protein